MKASSRSKRAPQDHPNGVSMYEHYEDSQPQQSDASIASNDPLMEAYQKMMADPRVAEQIAAQLNQAISSRHQDQGEVSVNNDSMYEQVLDSDVMAQLISDILPTPAETPYTPGLEDHHSGQMQIYDFSEHSNVPTQHIHTEPAAVPTPTNPSPKSRAKRLSSSHESSSQRLQHHQQSVHYEQHATQQHMQTHNQHRNQHHRTAMPISPLNPNPHPHFTVRTVASPGQSPHPYEATSSTSDQLSSASSSRAPSQSTSNTKHLPRNTSPNKTRHGDSGDAPLAKKRRER